jgi:hypothetical protein
MTESTGPQTPEEAAALRALAAKHRRRHRWIALLLSMAVSVFTTAILHAIWHGWPLDARGLAWLAFVVVHALGGLGPWVYCLRRLRAEEALDRQWTRQDARWRARDRA